MLAAIAIFTYVSLLALLIIISSAIANISTHAVLIMGLLICCLLLGYEYWHNPQNASPKRIAMSRSDFVAFIVAAVSFFLLAGMPLISLSTQKQHGNVLALITGNVDYGSHLSIFNDYLGLGKVRTWDASQTPRSVGGGFYPSSWHAANAAITSSFAPSLHPGAISAAIFGFINVFWLSVLMFFSTKMAFILYENLSKSRHKSLSTYIVISLLSLVSFYFFTVHIMRFGFFSFTPQLIAILLLSLCIRQLLRHGVGKTSTLGLATLYCGISLAAWVLLFPVAIGAVILVLLIARSRKNLNFASIKSDLLGNWPMYLVFTLSISAQLWLMLTVKSASTVGIRQGLLLDGGAPIYSTWVYALLLLGLAAAVAHTKKPEEYESILLPTVVAILFSSLLFVFQAYYTGTTHYYYYKSLLLIPTLLAPVGIAMAGITISKLKTPLAIMLSLSIPAAIMQLVPSDTNMISFLHGSRVVSSTVNSDVWSEMHREAYPTNRVTIYFVNSGTNETSTIATLLVQANRPYNQCFVDLNHDITFMSVDSALKKIASSGLPASCSGYDVVAKVSRDYASVIEGQVYAPALSVEYL